MDAKKSKCWTCKYGLCVQEETQETFHAPQAESENAFDLFPTDGEIKSYEVNHEHIKAICFWTPEGTKTEVPILTGLVSQCNRHATQ